MPKNRRTSNLRSKKAQDRQQSPQSEHNKRSTPRRGATASEDHHSSISRTATPLQQDIRYGSREPDGSPPQDASLKRTLEQDNPNEGVGSEQVETPPKKRRRTKAETKAAEMPLAVRSSGLRMLVGAHVSAAGGVQHSVGNAVHIGGNAFAMFLKSQRKWQNPPLKPEDRDHFVAGCIEKGFGVKHVLPHGSYLVNLGQQDADKAKQAYESFVEDLQRCEQLRIGLYNFHPGWTNNAPRPSAIARIANALNRAHRATESVVLVLETMTGASIGNSFEDLRDIIELVDDKSRIGVCIDTCHIFAAGYDIRSPQAFKDTMEKFDHIVGMQYLRAFHLNDSKAPLAAQRDLHQNIGLGFLGLRAFHNVMNESRFEGIPLVLETPTSKTNDGGKDIEDKGIWAREIKLLEDLIGKDPNSVDFRDQEADLAEQGSKERAKYAEAFEKKKAREQRKAEKGQKKLSFDQR